MRPAADRLRELLHAALADRSFVKLTLAAPRVEGAEVRQLILRPIALRGEFAVSCVWRHRTRDITKNLGADEAEQLVDHALRTEFRNANLFTTGLTAQFEERAGAAGRLRQGPPQHEHPAALDHDRQKPRAFAAHATPWLTALGVTTADGRVKQGMQGKLRQIEKFIEILSHRLPPTLLAPSRSLRVVDMGSGKGYLTFAIAAWLQQRGVTAEVIGIEQRKELVDLCNAAARAHALPSLRFEVGSIAESPLPACDVLVALHACDTATDDALAKGIAAQAEVIVASPCCHKELRTQLAPPAALATAMRHGILCDRQAELATDALRAALLAVAGYHADVFEFVATEHSAKNLMLFASKRPAIDRAAAQHSARELAAHFGVGRQRLAAHLGVALSDAAM